VSRGPGIPDENNTMYYYTPKPAEMPPISSRAFRHWFYTCRRRSFFCYFHKCQRRPCRGSREALDRIPKRIWRLEEEGNAWEFFWGLHTVERISTLKTAVYHLIVLLPSFIFWFLWLFDWGHSGDLQNGSVLFLCSLGLMSTFWSWFPLLRKQVL
jgi:hypothetical protein